jgi:hypothetical protein
MTVHSMLAGALILTVISAAPAPAASDKPRVPRAEYQVLLCEPVASLERKLALSPRAAPYETWLFDDSALSMFEHGLRFRLRVGGAGSELTLKVARQDCHEVAPGLVPGKEGKCEFDVYGNSMHGAVSLTRKLDSRQTRDLLERRTSIADALTPAQIRYLREIVKAWPLPADLRPLGPIGNRVLVTPSPKYDVDVSTLPDGERYAEISTKVPLAEVDRARASLDAHLADAGVSVCADQRGQAATKLRRLAGP